MRKNMLTTSQHYELRKRIDMNRAEAALSTATSALARQLGDELGFTITGANINAARQDLGISMRGNPASRTNRRDITTLANALADVYSELDKPIPEDLARLTDATGIPGGK